MILIERGERLELGVQLFFHFLGFGDEYLFFDVGVDAEVVFEDLQLGEEDAIEGFVCRRRLVEANGLTNVL